MIGKQIATDVIINDTCMNCNPERAIKTWSLPGFNIENPEITKRTWKLQNDLLSGEILYREDQQKGYDYHDNNHPKKLYDFFRIAPDLLSVLLSDLALCHSLSVS